MAHHDTVRAYVIRPTMDVFDGSGSLRPNAASALALIAEMVADSLRAGGDDSHHAAVWDGPTSVGTPPKLSIVAHRDELVALARKLLDPNAGLGGDIRSAVNCRTVTFGQDGQALLCLRREDSAPASPDSTRAIVTESSDWLAGTDLFDGSWPQN